MNKNYLSKEKLDILFDQIVQCARFARETQSQIIREYKTDGSVLTKTDIEISNTIIKTINELFPLCNVISEESITEFKKNAPFTFILDPIDGTDVYSQGLNSFAIALGILDQNRIPVGSMIVAPRFGIAREELLVRLDPGADLLIDNKPFKAYKNKDIPHQITVSSKLQKKLDFSLYNGKVRTFGSTILQILSALIFSNIEGCINQRAYAWDIAASHAVLLKMDLNVVYPNKEPLLYDDDLLIERKTCKDIIYCGSTKCIETLLKVLPPKNNN